MSSYVLTVYMKVYSRTRILKNLQREINSRN